MQPFRPAVIALTILTLLVGSLILHSPPFDSLPQIVPVNSNPPLPAFPGPATPAEQIPDPSAPTHDFTTEFGPNSGADIVQYFEQYPLSPSQGWNFGELVRRTRLLRDLVAYADQNMTSAHKESLDAAANRIATLLYPFLERSSQQSSSTSPLSDLRTSFTHGSAGIVIPAGNHNVRSASHLIRSLHIVLESTLPIQIVYAGEDDLSPSNKAFLASLISPAEKIVPLDFLDILSVFDDSTLKLRTGGRAIRPFAALGSTFEKVILLDCDIMFLQKPEVLLQYPAFERSGAFLFRDRLSRQQSFQDQHTWWKSRIERPSANLEKSPVWFEDDAERGSSGVVVVDKGRTDVLVGLLHTCWQNSYAMRQGVTYKNTYGYKETWWMGFELAGSSYEMEEHYESIVGWEDTTVDNPDRKRVCSSSIAHLGHNNELIWYSGSLLKNKQIPDMTFEYAVPDKWMADAEWQKDESKPEMSCMIGGELHNIPEAQIEVLEWSIMEAQWVDQALGISSNLELF